MTVRNPRAEPGESPRTVGFVIVGIVVLPMIAWISAGIFNVDPDRPFSLRLVIDVQSPRPDRPHPEHLDERC